MKSLIFVVEINESELDRHTVSLYERANSFID